jgi:hypothetical protein
MSDIELQKGFIMLKKKLLSVVVASVMLVAMAFSVSAASRVTGTYSTSGGNMSYNGSQTVSGACIYYYLRLNSVSFNGLPSNTFPSNAYVHLSICKNKSEKASKNFYSCYGHTGSYSQSGGTYQLGLSSNSTLGLTVGATWNAQEIL